MFHPDAPDLLAVLDRYERPLIRYAQSIVGDMDSARDVVQEVFIRLATRGITEEGRRVASGEADGRSAESADTTRHSAPDPTPSAYHLEAWLFTVTRHRALDHQRKHRRIIPMILPDDRACEAPSPAATLASRDGEASLLRLLDELPPNQREVIRLKFQNDLSYREIADVMKLSVTNVGFLLHTGLKKLRALASELPQDDLGLTFRNVLP